MVCVCPLLTETLQHFTHLLPPPPSPPPSPPPLLPTISLFPCSTPGMLSLWVYSMVFLHYSLYLVNSWWDCISHTRCVMYLACLHCQQIVYLTGYQELCYYNFECAHPWGVVRWLSCDHWCLWNGAYFIFCMCFMQCFQQYLEQHWVLIAGNILYHNSNNQVCMSLSVYMSVHSSMYFHTIYRHCKDCQDMKNNTEFWVSGVLWCQMCFDQLVCSSHMEYHSSMGCIMQWVRKKWGLAVYILV